MKIDFKALVEMMALAEIKKKNPKIAELYGVFMKRGISMSVAQEMLLEIVTLASEMEEGAGNGKS